MPNTKVSVLGIASTYVGTVVGAGYASGQEILQYFVYFGKGGLAAILVCSVLFFLLGYFAIALGRKLKTSAYQKIISPVKSKLPAHFSDFLILFSLIGTFVIMIAGSGASFQKQFGTPEFVGALVLIVLCIYNLFHGLKGLVFVQTAIVPVMMIVAIGVSLYAIYNPVLPTDHAPVINSSPIIKNWFISALLYISFNVQLAIAVLVPIGHKSRGSVRTLFWGTLFGGAFLGIGVLVEYYALIANAEIIGTTTLPLVELAGRISPLLQLVYTIVLFFGLYSTAISCFFGAVERCSTFPFVVRFKFSKMHLAIIIALVCFVASHIGFVKLVGYLYPLLGYGGLLIMLLMSIKYIKRIGFRSKLD